MKKKESLDANCAARMASCLNKLGRSEEAHQLVTHFLNLPVPGSGSEPLKYVESPTALDIDSHWIPTTVEGWKAQDEKEATVERRAHVIEIGKGQNDRA